jgi:parvulin-like peptidyl-prolyl isomerase
MNLDLSLHHVDLVQLHQRTIEVDRLISLLGTYQLLPQLYQALLIDQAIEPIECGLEETQQARQQFYEAQGITGESERQAWILQRGLTEAQLEFQATRSLRIEKFKQATWGNKLEAYFLTCKPQLDQVIYSMIRTSSLSTAQELYFRIKAGEQSFADVAREYSQGVEAQTGGLIGPMPISQPHPALAARLRSTQPGQLLPPTRFGEWIVILRLEKLIPARLDDAMRQKLLDKLFQDWLQQSVNTLMTSPAHSSIVTSVTS